MKKHVLFLLVSCVLLGKNYSQITVDTAIVPRYIQGNSSTNNSRIPFYFWVELSGLTPGATYRYYTVMDSAAAPLNSSGAGNSLPVNMLNQVFLRITSVSMTNSAGHDTLIADVSGEWRGWMGIETTGNTRFTPGNVLCPQIHFNNGAGGTGIASRVRLVSYPVNVINFGTTPGSAVQGSFLYDSTTLSPKNFVFLYDNVNGTGRPVASAVIEKDGLDLHSQPSFVAAYRNNVDTFDHRWGTIIPNNLPDGIRRVEYRNFAAGAIVADIQDTDGNWCFLNTVNPSNGSTAAMLRSLDNTGFIGFLDLDGDTYGDPSTGTLVPCHTPGYVTDSTDCDDSNPGVNPGAPEICNGIDDNCNQLVDETCAAEMDVSESGNPLPNHATYNYGSVAIGADPNLVLTIENTGNDTLFFSGTPIFTGPFAAGGSLPQFLLAGSNTSFTITSQITTSGTITGSVSIPNSDPDENPYVINFLANGFTGLALYEGFEMTLFPNPVQDVLQVSWAAAPAGAYELVISDLAGRTVLVHPFVASAGSGILPVSMETMTGGVYMVTLRSAAGAVIARQKVMH